MKKIMYILTGAALMLLGSCVKDISEGDGKPANGKLRLSISVDDISTGAATRTTVAPELGEEQISSLYLLFFQPNAYRDGVFVDYIKIKMPAEGYMNMDIQMPVVDIDIAGTSISASAPYNILAVANIGDGRYVGSGTTAEAWIEQFAGKTERQVAFEATAVVAEWFAVGRDAILMSGHTEKTASQTQINLLLSRDQARFDVINNISAAYDLVSVSIWNAYPTLSVWGEGAMDYSASASRIRKYYGIDNTANVGAEGADGRGPILGNILGGLYTFENVVTSPDKNDNQTTCLILGLMQRETGQTTYYRVNMVTGENSQVLRRNYAYRLSIRSVSGPGAASEELAYIGQGNSLEYTINNWGLDNLDLIVSDANSILSVPTKRVSIGREASVSNFSIYTFTTLSDAMPLTVRSQTYTPADNSIRARLDGNTLVIEADALGLEQTERRGVIVLSFAGLETSISICQSGKADDFLLVHLPDGGIPRFLSFAGISSGLIRVEASGTWTAKLYMEGFSFNSLTEPNPVVNTLQSTSGAVVDNKFRVFTHSANDGERARDAFIVVSLDKDPDNYAAVVRLSQAAAGIIKLDPATQESVIFTGTGALANLAGNDTNDFLVQPGVDTDSSTPVIKGWTASIIRNGAQDDSQYFKIVNGAGYGWDANDAAKNRVKVETVGMNTSGRQYTATMRIVLTSDPGTFKDVTLVQYSAEFNFSTNTLSDVGTKGGRTQPVSILTEPSLKWSASIKTNSGTSTDGRKLVQHEAKLVDQNGNPIVPGNLYDLSTQFSVEFPKVYYPNREIPISATVTVTVGGGMTKTITVSQTTLTPRQVVSYNLTGSAEYWGELSMDGGRYNQAWTSAVWAIPGHPTTTSTGALLTATIPSNVTYLHVVPQEANGATAQNWNWANVNDFMKNRDAFTVFSQQSNSRDAINNANSPVKKAGYQNVAYAGNSNNAKITDQYSSTKIYQFLMDKGNQPLTLSDSGMVNDFWMDGTHTVLPAPWPTSAVVMMTKNDNANNATLIIDVENGFLYIGECQMFWQNGNGAENLRPWGQKFLDNMMFYIANASRYGSHFTDLLIEEGRPGAMPAPWDNYWGANKGVPSK